MLRLLRATRCMAVFAALLSAMVIVGTTEGWHPYDADEQSPSFHDHAAHRVVLRSDRPDSQQPTEHCYLCHWLRAFEHGLSISASQLLSTSSRSHGWLLLVVAPQDVFASLISARAPPR